MMRRAALALRGKVLVRDVQRLGENTQRSASLSVECPLRSCVGGEGIACDRGQGKMSDLDLLDSVAGNILGRTICALGDAAARPVQAMLRHFREEFIHHIEHGCCAVPMAAGEALA